MQTEITLIAGWLGSGKTSVIGNVLSSGMHEKRVAVIIREFVETQFDAFRLPQDWVDLTVVCAPVGRVELTIDEIERVLSLNTYRDIVVEVVDFGEAVTVAKEFLPGGRLDGKATLKLSVTVLDASAFDRQAEEHADILRAQIAGADRVIVNKADKIHEEDKPRFLQFIKNANPKVTPAFAYMGQVRHGFVIDSLPEGEVPQLIEQAKTPPLLPDFDSYVYKSHAVTWDRVYFAHKLLNLDTSVERFKGVLRCHDRSWGLTGVARQLDWDPIVTTGPTRIAFVGIGLKAFSGQLQEALDAENARQDVWVRER